MKLDVNIYAKRHSEYWFMDFGTNAMINHLQVLKADDLNLKFTQA